MKRTASRCVIQSIGRRWFHLPSTGFGWRHVNFAGVALYGQHNMECAFITSDFTTCSTI